MTSVLSRSLFSYLVSTALILVAKPRQFLAWGEASLRAEPQVKSDQNEHESRSDGMNVA